MAEFVHNPAFRPHLERAVMQAMADTIRQTQDDVERALTPVAIRDKAPVVTEGPQREANGDVSGVVKYGRGLGPIFERGTKQRRTRRGANRGRISTANNAMEKARNEAIRRGLDLSRYL
jgi:hypothetical protein